MTIVFHATKRSMSTSLGFKSFPPWICRFTRLCERDIVLPRLDERDVAREIETVSSLFIMGGGREGEG